MRSYQIAIAYERRFVDLLRHVSFFVAVADAGQVGLAAAELGMTQPPVSQGLQRLEAELGVRLFDRNARGVQLTSAGRELLPLAQAMLEGERGLRDAAAASTGRRVSLRLGFAPQIPAAAMAAAALSCSEVVDGQVDVVTESTTALTRLVSTGRLDVAVIRHPAVLGSLVGGAVLRVPTVALVPRAHRAIARRSSPRRAARETPIQLQSLAGLPVATPAREDEPAAYDLLMDTLAEHGVAATSLPAPDGRAALSMVAMGRAIAFTVERDTAVEGVASCVLAGDPVPLRLRPVWRDEMPAGVIEALMGRLRQELLP
jgi:DNA-binding transcriptional LysR family regulator